MQRRAAARVTDSVTSPAGHIMPASIRMSRITSTSLRPPLGSPTHLMGGFSQALAGIAPVPDLSPGSRRASSSLSSPMCASEQIGFENSWNMRLLAYLMKKTYMKTKLATTCFIIGTLLAPIAAHADTDTDRTHPVTFITDSVITTKIKAKLAADHPGSMKHISVDTSKDGVVWLSGTANNQAEIDQALTIARNTENVKTVWSDLKIENDR